MSLFRRPPVRLLTVLVIIAGTWTLWTMTHAMRLHRDVHTQAAAVTEQYARFAGETEAFWNDAGVRAAGMASGQDIQSVVQRMSSSDDVHTRLQAVREMQKYIRSAAEAIGMRPILALASGADLLRKEAVRGGDITPVFDAYNLAVMEWNLMITGHTGRFGARLIGAEPEPFPLLNFDGRSETETVIRI